MSGPKCEIRACSEPLEASVGRDGRVRFACPRCARRRAGLCLDCPVKVVGRAWRCPRCRKRHLAARAREKRRHASRRLAGYVQSQLTRKDARRCVDCGGSVAGRSWRCEPCKVKRLEQYAATYRSKHADKLRAAARAWYQTNPANRRRRNEYKRRLRQDRRYYLREKRRQRLTGTGGYATREKYLAYHRAYYRRKAAERAVA